MTLRAALVCPYSLDTPGGVATHVLGLARWLQSEGHNVTVVAPGTRAVDHGVPVMLLGPATSFAFNGSVAQLAIRPGQARAARALVSDADVVHVHEPLTPGIGYAVARSARRLAVTHHASFQPVALRPALRLRAALLPKRISLAVSAAAAATAQAVTGLAPVVVPNAIDLPASPRPRGGRPRVVFVGRLDEPRKGYETFVSVAAQVPEAEFVAVGPGGGGHSHVRELGVLSAADLEATLGTASVLMAPNRFGESFGLILVEGLAHGCALVAADLPAFRDVIADPQLVTWFPPGDVVAATLAVRHRLASLPDPLLGWQAAHRFTWPVVGPRILAVYEATQRLPRN